MIRIERVALPDGLRALAHRDAHGNLVIYVSETLDAPGQRAAVAEAVRALRRTGWHAGVPTAGIAFLVALRTWAGRIAGVIRAHRTAWGAAAVTATAGAAAAGLFLTTAPHGPAAAGGRPGPVPSEVLPSAPAGQQAAPPLQGGAGQPAPAVQSPPEHGQTGHPPGKAGTGTSRSEPPTPAPAPASSPTPPAPTSAPVPSPPAHTGSGTCISLLGIHLCLRL